LNVPERTVRLSVVKTKTFTSDWRRSRLAARLLIQGTYRPLSPRRKLLAGVLAGDPGVTNRLIKQALLSLYAQRPHCICLD
jgi:hypothetical protein